MKKSRLFLSICVFFIGINFNSVLISAFSFRPHPGCNLVYYSQGDYNWSCAYVGGAQFEPNGCAPTCLAMIASSFGHITSPLEWGEKMLAGHFWRKNGGTGNLPPDIAAKYGLPISYVEFAMSLEGLNATPLWTQSELEDFLKSSSFPVTAACYFESLEPTMPGETLHAVILSEYRNGQTFLIDPSSNAVTGWWDVSTIWKIRRSRSYGDSDKNAWAADFYGISGRQMCAGVYRLYNPFVRDNLIQLPDGVDGFYNEGVGLHHYTINTYEIEKMANEGWSYEQVAFLDKGEHPLYRLFNPNDGNHHFTMNVNERDDLVNRGWHDEGVGWRVALAGQPVFRIYNPGNGEHIYTLNYEEVKAAVAAGMIDEGVAWWC
ncbi:MAG: hypothetical protein LBF82_02815 [Lactobacillales bacterium]|nr:hypothetical protein [Lactobacillales bacterium]